MTIIRVEKGFRRGYIAVQGWPRVVKLVKDYVATHPRGKASADTMLVEANKMLKLKDEWDSLARSNHAIETGKWEQHFHNRTEVSENTNFDFCVYDRSRNVYGLCIWVRGDYKFPPGDELKYLEMPRRLRRKYFIPPHQEYTELPKVLQGGYVYLVLRHDRKRWFTVDFEPILRALDDALDVSRIKGETVAQKMLAVQPLRRPAERRFGERSDAMMPDDVFILQKRRGIEVTIEPSHGIKDQYPVYDDWGPRGTRSVQGSTFRGQLRNDRLCHPKHPYLVIEFKPEKPIWEPEKEGPLVELTTRVEQALLTLVRVA